ncbi:MAG: aldehyde dehydrogenase family protein [Acidobacteria bacterium]|nr:aldehyde dehydrogenase family protein [Acidobacteriota bacterium]MCW5949670.1 aldehyde dehydrogenase family protein [Pyrinomonadaceae bacterium]
MTTYRSYIGGEWIESASGITLPNVNPADINDVIGHSELCTRDEARRAVESAYAAFREWKNTPAPARGRILTRLARLMEEHKYELARMLTREEGKVLSEALGEVQRATNVVEFCAGETRRFNGETIPSELPSNWAYTIREPHGVVALVTPWNFPIAIPVWKIAPALAAGNAVVFKPASNTPASAVRIVELLIEAGLPKGVLNLVIGSGSEAGDEIINHAAVRAVSFTGSTEIGLKMYETVARRGIPFQAEMGGKNPVVVLPDCDIDLAVEHTAAGAFGSTGQRCTATSRAVVVGDIADRFVEKIVARAKAYKLGPGLDGTSEIGPSVDESQFNTVLKYIEIGREDGATLLCGGGRATGDALDNGYFVEPTVFDNVTPDMRIFREEIFGPVLGIIRVKDLDEAMTVANDCDYGLSSSVFSNDYNSITRFVNEIESGMTHINSPTTGGEAHIPFGGIKGSGIGPREQGSASLEFYSEMKVVYVDHTGRKREGNLY